MVGVSYDQKPYRRAMIETWGGTVHRSPTDITEAGRSQASHPSGSLGIAISEAVEVAAKSEDTNYSLGSVLNHVCLHQTVIGQESIAAMEMAGEYPDVVVGCVGGGSNFAGLIYPFVRANLREGKRTRFLGAEPAACPTLTRGTYAYDFGDTVGMTPLMPMYTLGHDFVPPPVHAGGLRYHGDAPSLCALVKEGMVEATAVPQTAAFEAAVRFASCEGIIPGPEPAHAIRAVFDEAEAAKQAGEERVILLGLSGHGHFDMSAYSAYHAGELEDLEFSESEMQAALERLPEAPSIA
jgi:tryptophan synthase beta chain